LQPREGAQRGAVEPADEDALAADTAAAAPPWSYAALALKRVLNTLSKLLWLLGAGVGDGSTANVEVKPVTETKNFSPTGVEDASRRLIPAGGVEAGAAVGDIPGTGYALPPAAIHIGSSSGMFDGGCTSHPASVRSCSSTHVWQSSPSVMYLWQQASHTLHPPFLFAGLHSGYRTDGSG
jgi:hypothetical protein